MKPVALVERAIRNSSKSRDIVLDPFGGSGSTLIACEKSGRQARLVELDPRYCDVIVRRWQEWTGEQATLEGDGRSFEEIAAGHAAAAAWRRPAISRQGAVLEEPRQSALGHAAEQLVDLEPERAGRRAPCRRRAGPAASPRARTRTPRHG